MISRCKSVGVCRINEPSKRHDTFRFVERGPQEYASGPGSYARRATQTRDWPGLWPMNF